MYGLRKALRSVSCLKLFCCSFRVAIMTLRSTLSTSMLLALLAFVAVTHHGHAQEADGEVPAPAPAPQALPLPDSPEKTCSSQAFHQATSESYVCSDTMYNYKDPELSCCKALFKYYGVNSTEPSRNCFCYEPYWTYLQGLEDTIYIQLMPYLDFCTSSDLTIAYYQDGEGPCAGLPPAASETSSETSSESVVGRSLGQWIRDLHGEGLMGFSFAVGLVSAVGFVAMLWPLAADTILQICKMSAKKTA